MFREKVCALCVLISLAAAVGKGEFQVNTYTEHNQTHPAVAMNDAGDFVVVWRSHCVDGRGGGVFARCFDANGAPVSPEIEVNASQVDVDNWTPAVAVGPAGGFVVVWVALRNGDCDLLARMFDSQGLATTGEFQVNESTPKAGQSMPSIAMNSTGDFVIVRTDWSGGCYSGKSHVVGRLYDSGGTPRSGDFVISDNTNADWPDVAMDCSGRFIVAWIRLGDTYNRPYGEYIMSRQYEADGTPAGGAAQITSDLNSRWYGPSVAMDRSSGQYVITWAAGPFPYDIVAQHFDADGMAMTEPYMVNTCLGNNQGHPRVAANGQGEYLIVWDSLGQDGSYSGVFGQRCARSGELVDAECCINACVQGRQWYPDVAMGGGNKSVVVWISDGQDGSGYGIFAELWTD